MKILLVYPSYPDTFWSFRHALKFTPRKALNTPLGMLTIAAMLPDAWEKRAIDMNVSRLKDKDILWADYIFVSAMIAQQKSAREVIARCRKLDKKIVAGGPLLTLGYGMAGFEYLGDVDHVILNEAEISLPRFLADLAAGNPKPVYRTDEKADVTTTPIPRFDLLDLSQYASVTVQYSRGCPYDCEFCDIVIMDGHTPRTKTRDQLLAELDAVYRAGYKGSVFIVDDNFIGNKKKLKAEILPAITRWQTERDYPFSFLTEASINLADDEELMQLMSAAGFNNVFVGIESPNEDSLTECNKYTNKNRDLVSSVKKLQNFGFQVMGGFIVGFDSDPVSIFKSQIGLIQKSGIVTAMVGMLVAPPETRLWHRMNKENRLLPGGSGDNTDGTTNFIPKMGLNALVNGYQQVLHAIYTPKNYYKRIHTFLKEYKPNEKATRKFKFEAYHIMGLLKSTFFLGIKDSSRLHYWKLVLSTLRRYPKLIGLSITLAVQGFHFRKVYEKIKKIKVDESLLERTMKALNGELA